MLNLPKREEQIRVEPDSEEAQREGVVLILETLSGREKAQLFGDSSFRVRSAGKATAQNGEMPDLDEDQFEISLPMEKMVDVVDRKLIGAENMGVGEESFDADNPEHLESIPVSWKFQAAGELFREATLSEAQGKSSGPLETTSPEDTTRGNDSTDGSPVSSTASAGSTGRG